MHRILWALSLILIALPLSGETWYVRKDGGSRYSAKVPTGQCDGKADSAYRGKGVNQHCAFGDFRYLYDDRSYGVRPGPSQAATQSSCETVPGVLASIRAPAQMTSGVTAGVVDRDVPIRPFLPGPQPTTHASSAKTTPPVEPAPLPINRNSPSSSAATVSAPLSTWAARSMSTCNASRSLAILNAQLMETLGFPVIAGEIQPQ